ncbi:MAG: TetR/AcrR family transcriptional regulator [Pseudomonadota bacterium]
MKKKRVRRKDPEKRAAILAAAGELFLEKSKGTISMDDVAKRAAVSKITVYNHFADKSELFRTMIEAKLNANLSFQLIEDLDGEDAFEDLVKIAKGYTNIIYSHDGLNMFKTVMAETKRDSDVPQMFYRAAVRPVRETLSKHLHKLEQQGGYEFIDIELAADIFFTLFRGDAFMRLSMNIDQEPKAEALDQFTRKVIRLYLRMFERTHGERTTSTETLAYLNQIQRFTASLEVCQPTLVLMRRSVSHPDIAEAIAATEGAANEALESFKQLLRQHKCLKTPRHSKALKALCDESVEEISASEESEIIRDSLVAGYLLQIVTQLHSSIKSAAFTATQAGLDGDSAVMAPHAEGLDALTQIAESTLSSIN